MSQLRKEKELVTVTDILIGRRKNELWLSICFKSLILSSELDLKFHEKDQEEERKRVQEHRQLKKNSYANMRSMVSSM